jgi:hypothetical protein
MKPSLRAETWDVLALALDPIDPPSRTRARLMAELTGGARYLPFAADLARHFELDSARLHELLGRMADPAAWNTGIDPTIGYLHFRPGAALVPLRAGIVRMRAGARVPIHRHRDRELTYVLEGAVVDGSGQRFAPGDALLAPAGSVHALAIDSGADCVMALLHGAIEFLGE